MERMRLVVLRPGVRKGALGCFARRRALAVAELVELFTADSAVKRSTLRML